MFNLSGSANQVNTNLSCSPEHTNVSATLIIPISLVALTLSNLIPIKFFRIVEFDKVTDAVAVVVT